MTEEQEVQTDADTEDSPPETSDSTPPDEEGQEEPTAEAEVGVEEKTWTPDMGFQAHPDWQKREEKLREAELRAERAEAEKQAYLQQLQQAQQMSQVKAKEEPKVYSRSELEQLVDEGEMQGWEAAAILADQQAAERERKREAQKLTTESNQRALQALPDFATPGTESNKVFTELASTDYSTLFDAVSGQPLVHNAYELVAKAAKKELDNRAKATNSRATEEQRRRAIDRQMAKTVAPDGSTSEEETMSDALSQLDERQRDYLRKKHRVKEPTEKMAKEYLEWSSAVPDKLWPEKARRPG